ncbi:adenosylmethionine decarboxylase [candidate division WWE3 bacterium CG08_land_8_20_14_0_20_43_13]|uniref:Adenosylmethionine decarboxylase n=1 Tax=candidate division WWE3 bacterium CG08_land_8_20_14_0_20_43_13 TaxID=1975087 RepID=A0A2H0X880_UNCKA|nr:MAG: adenosylmethionine decarboxylase [candidate division WWE3 bacterium CG08_land_8_20_14_0_20_43_13]
MVKYYHFMNKKAKDVFINHIAARIENADSSFLNCPELLEEALTKVCQETGLSIVKRVSHQFNPTGVSLVFILGESHLAVHTWPESKFAHLDLVTCSGATNVNILKNSLIKNFKTDQIKIKIIDD